MPPSVGMGDKGVNTLECRIQQDGHIPKDSLRLEFSSGRSDLDAASLARVREAAPFSERPEKSSQPLIELRYTF